MTVMEISKRYGILPKDIIAFILANATFPVKRNLQTGEMSIPDDIDVDAFLAPMLGLEQQKVAQKDAQKKQAVDLKIEQEKSARREAEQKHFVEIEKLKRTGAEGYYQYKAISLLDVSGLFNGNSGRVNVEAMTRTLNELGMEGWHLVTA